MISTYYCLFMLFVRKHIISNKLQWHQMEISLCALGVCLQLGPNCLPCGVGLFSCQNEFSIGFSTLKFF